MGWPRLRHSAIGMAAPSRMDGAVVELPGRKTTDLRRIVPRVQTRGTQKPVPARACWFDPHLRHPANSDGGGTLQYARRVRRGSAYWIVRGALVVLAIIAVIITGSISAALPLLLLLGLSFLAERRLRR